MRIVFNTRILSLICFTLFMGMVSSCKKDSDISSISGKTELLSYGPSGVKHGEEIQFIGRNLDKVTAIDFVGASVSSSAFLTQTKELIVLVVPQETERGVVTLKTTDGDVVSKTEIDFEVPVVISSFTQIVRPGDNITITGEFMNWITGVQFAKDTIVTEFVSHSLTELVVTVPMTAETGTLIFWGAGTEPLTIESEEELQVTLPTITELSPNPIERGKNLTIKGTDLDLTKAVLFKGESAIVTEFVSQSATQLVVKIPESANKGKVSLVTYSDIAIESENSLLFVGDLPDLAPLGFALYVDKFENNTQNWGWSTNTDFANSENVRDGELAIKVEYNGSWGAVKLANFSTPTAPFSELTFSIFGTAGSGGKVINLSANGGPTYTITVEEGKWVEYKLSMADIGNPESISDLMFQEAGWAGTIYLDHIGLR